MSGTTADVHALIVQMQADQAQFRLQFAARLTAIAMLVQQLKDSVTPTLGADDLATLNAIDTDIKGVTQHLTVSGLPPAVDPAMPASFVYDATKGLYIDTTANAYWDPVDSVAVPFNPPVMPPPAPPTPATSLRSPTPTTKNDDEGKWDEAPKDKRK